MKIRLNMAKWGGVTEQHPREQGLKLPLMDIVIPAVEFQVAIVAVVLSISYSAEIERGVIVASYASTGEVMSSAVPVLSLTRDRRSPESMMAMVSG